MKNTASTTERNKLINAIIYFASNTAYCGKIKLFKLLYLADFEHFHQTGKSITGYEYQAWKFGPVPVELMEEWEDLECDLSDAVHIVSEKVIDHVRQTVKVNKGVKFDADIFTPRQLKIMGDISTKYKSTRSPEMIDVTHEQNGAWDKVWKDGLGSKDVIPYEMSLDDSDDKRTAFIEILNNQRMYQSAINAARLSANQPVLNY